MGRQVARTEDLEAYIEEAAEAARSNENNKSGQFGTQSVQGVAKKHGKNVEPLHGLLVEELDQRYKSNGDSRTWNAREPRINTADKTSHLAGLDEEREKIAGSSGGVIDGRYRHGPGGSKSGGLDHRRPGAPG